MGCRSTASSFATNKKMSKPWRESPKKEWIEAGLGELRSCCEHFGIRYESKRDAYVNTHRNILDFHFSTFTWTKDIFKHMIFDRDSADIDFISARLFQYGFTAETVGVLRELMAEATKNKLPPYTALQAWFEAKEKSWYERERERLGEADLCDGGSQ
jgi:hypothetical protein